MKAKRKFQWAFKVGREGGREVRRKRGKEGGRDGGRENPCSDVRHACDGRAHSHPPPSALLPTLQSGVHAGLRTASLLVLAVQPRDGTPAASSATTTSTGAPKVCTASPPSLPPFLPRSCTHTPLPPSLPLALDAVWLVDDARPDAHLKVELPRSPERFSSRDEDGRSTGSGGRERGREGGRR